MIISSQNHKTNANIQSIFIKNSNRCSLLQSTWRFSSIAQRPDFWIDAVGSVVRPALVLYGYTRSASNWTKGHTPETSRRVSQPQGHVVHLRKVRFTAENRHP